MKFYTFGAGDSQRITAYMDNVTFSVAPQPMTLILLGLGGLLFRKKDAPRTDREERRGTAVSRSWL